MKKAAFYFFILVYLISCKEDEKVFPIEPFIEFKNLEFNDITDPTSADVLTLEFYFRDGDSDLGSLEPSAKEPYNPRDYYLKSTGKKCSFSEDYFSSDFRQSFSRKIPDLITYKDRKTAGMDTLPEFIPPFTCNNWELVGNQKVIDTVYFTVNSNFYNIHVDFYTQSNSNWELVDFNYITSYPMCIPFTFYGVFPQMAGPKTVQGQFLINAISSKEGIMKYSMENFGFKHLFSGKRIKLKVRIQDRALHKSNEIETSEIQF